MSYFARTLPRCMLRSFAVVSFVLLAVLASTSHAQSVDVTGQMSVSRSGLVFNRTTQTFDTVVTLTNSLIPVSGPVLLVISSISANGVTLANGSGTTVDGKPYVEALASPGQILPGQSVSGVILKFRNPSRIAFTFSTNVTAQVRPVITATSAIGVVDTSGGVVGLPGVAKLIVPAGSVNSAAIEVALDPMPEVDEAIREFPEHEVTGAPRVRVKSSTPFLGPVQLVVEADDNAVGSTTRDLSFFGLFDTDLGLQLSSVGGGVCGNGAYCTLLWPHMFQPIPLDPLDPVGYFVLVSAPAKQKTYTPVSVSAAAVTPSLLDLLSASQGPIVFGAEVILSKVKFPLGSQPITDNLTSLPGRPGVPMLSSPFLLQRTVTINNTPKVARHTGVDIVTIDLATDVSLSRIVWSVLPGIVSESRCWKENPDKTCAKENVGEFIEVQHDNMSSLYGHLASRYASKDAPVASSAFLGYSGNTGGTTGPHLHFGLWLDGGRVDPRPYLFENMSMYLLPADPSDELKAFADSTRVMALRLKGGGGDKILDLQSFAELFDYQWLTHSDGRRSMTYGVATGVPGKSLVHANGDASFIFQSRPIILDANDLAARLANLNIARGEKLKVELSFCTFRLGPCRVVHSWELNPRAMLKVAVAGTGTGGIASVPAGVQCPPDCDQAFDAGSNVELTASPSPGASFVEWRGDCVGTQPYISLVMDVDKTCEAVFDVASSVTSEWTELSNETTGSAVPLESGITEYSCSNRQIHEYSQFRDGNLEQRFNVEFVYSQRAGAYPDYETVLYLTLLSGSYLGSSSITEILDGNIDTASGGLGGFTGLPTIETFSGRPAYAIRYPSVDDDIPAVVSFYCNPLTGRGFCSADPRFVLSCDLPGWP